MANETVVIGEGMLELTRADGTAQGWALRSGGDALNVAIYMARLGARVAFLTALGDDTISQGLRAEWAAEAVDTSMILTQPGRLPGMYLVETDSAGERSFHYWRENAAARALLSCQGIDVALARASDAACLYLSGISLSIIAEAQRARLVQLCADVRQSGGLVAFDPNYRPRGWQSPDAARAAIAQIAPHVSIVLPTFVDEVLLHGDATVDACFDRWQDYGVGEIVVKLGASGVEISGGGSRQIVAAEINPAPRDTTGAGDAFNAAYLCARLRGDTQADAAVQGNLLAAAVIRYPGAIIGRNEMAGVGALRTQG